MNSPHCFLETPSIPECPPSARPFTGRLTLKNNAIIVAIFISKFLNPNWLNDCYYVTDIFCAKFKPLLMYFPTKILSQIQKKNSTQQSHIHKLFTARSQNHLA